MRERAASIARAWIRSVRADGTIREPLAVKPAPFPAGYGELMLAGVLAADAQRSGDAVSGAAASQIAAAATAGTQPTDPFNLLAGATLMQTLSAGPVAGFATGFSPWITGYGPFEHDAKSGGACLAKPGCYTNWRLVWAAGAAELLTSSAGGPPGSLLGDRAATSQQIQSNVTLAARYAAPAATVPLGAARNISDPSGRSPAYHVLSAYLLDRTAHAAPLLDTPQAARLRDESNRFALTLMAPDGQLSWAGRSLDQSWVMAAAAALGARRAAARDPLAPAWRTFADRALERLSVRYRSYADGTLPIVPGLRKKKTRTIIDKYAGVVQYNGLTAWLLADAAEHWPESGAPRSPLPSDAMLLAHDLPGSGLIWGGAGGVFWSFAGRSPAQTDARGARGVTLVKRARGAAPASRWDDLVALRPRKRPLTTWLLYRAGEPASLQIDSVSGTGARAALRGRWVQGGRTIRPATVRVRVTDGRRLVLSTSVRARETLSLTVYTRTRKGALRASGPRAQVKSGACTLSASGRSCPRAAYFRGSGTARLRIG